MIAIDPSLPFPPCCSSAAAIARLQSMLGEWKTQAQVDVESARKLRACLSTATRPSHPRHDNAEGPRRLHSVVVFVETAASLLELFFLLRCFVVQMALEWSTSALQT